MAFANENLYVHFSSTAPRSRPRRRPSPGARIPVVGSALRLGRCPPIFFSACSQTLRNRVPPCSPPSRHLQCCRRNQRRNQCALLIRIRWTPSVASKLLAGRRRCPQIFPTRRLPIWQGFWVDRRHNRGAPRCDRQAVAEGRFPGSLKALRARAERRAHGPLLR